MSIWNKFYKLTKLDFDYEGVIPGTIPAIYANSRNQVDVIISIQVDGEEGPLDLKEDDLKDLLYFCDYTTGEKLDQKWNISNNVNDYTKSVSAPNARKRRDVSTANSAITYLHRYLSCSESNIRNIFAVGINIPGVGRFDTSRNGTSTANGPKGGPGSLFKSPKYLTIATLHPIDYSDLKNLAIPEIKKFKDMKSVANDVLVQTGMVWLSNNYIGKSCYSSIKIKTQKGFLFRNKNIKRNNVKISAVNICGVNNSADMVCARPRLHGYDLQSYANNFDFTLIFIDSPKCGISSGSSFHMIDEHLIRNDHMYYNIGSNDHRHELTPENSTIPKIDSGYLSIVICNYTIPDLGFFSSWYNDLNFKAGWNNNPADGVTNIEVFDEYGNSGWIKVKLDYGDRNYPKVVINDQIELFN